MTREEAIKILKSKLDGSVDTSWEWTEAVRMAIEALADRPTESDFISKAKVLETYSELYWFDSDCEVVSKAEVDKIYERLQSLPSADRPTGWIPVSERLPGKNGCYLISTTGTNNYIIDIAYYIEGLWHKVSRIKAWMPLPEPYREDGEA